jgi:acetyl esterase/lipase
VSKLAFPGVQGLTTFPPEGSKDLVWIESANLRNPAWYLKPRTGTPPRAVVLYCHGNAMTISEMEESMQHWCDALNVIFVVPEIPGAQYDWGRMSFKAEGEPEMASEARYFEAAEAAADWARAQHADLKLIVWGQSLGSGAACHVGVSKVCVYVCMFLHFVFAERLDIES